MKTIVTANPGFFLVCVSDDKEDLFKTDPIIAWEFDSENGITPITPEGRVTTGFWGYLCPEGMVMWPGVASYSSLEEANKNYWKMVREKISNAKAFTDKFT